MERPAGVGRERPAGVGRDCFLMERPAGVGRDCFLLRIQMTLIFSNHLSQRSRALGSMV